MSTTIERAVQPEQVVSRSRVVKRRGAGAAGALRAWSAQLGAAWRDVVVTGAEAAAVAGVLWQLAGAAVAAVCVLVTAGALAGAGLRAAAVAGFVLAAFYPVVDDVAVLSGAAFLLVGIVAGRELKVSCRTAGRV